jgi:hypothetical protein
LHASAIALAFTGGCVATAVFFAPLLWWRTWTLIGLTAVAAILLAWVAGWLVPKYSLIESRAWVQLQLVFWALGGLSILALAAGDLWRRRDAGSWLLVFWVWGTFVFAALVNWTVNGRSILPMVPAVAILIARRLEQRPGSRGQPAAICLAAGAAVSFAVVGADASLAHATRRLAAQVSAAYQRPPAPLWFQGHWGFQYYMQELGASPVDFKSSPLKLGDTVVVPSNNTNLLPPDSQRSVSVGTITVKSAGALTTMDQTTGAGFYSSVWGPLPFAFGHVPPEYARVYELRQPSVATPPNSQ